MADKAIKAARIHGFTAFRAADRLVPTMEFQPALRLRAESKRIDIGYWRIDNQSGERVQQPVQIVARFAITL